MMKTYHGSCHCGAVRYEADLDLSQDTIKCNCSICRKARSWLAFVPEQAFRVTEGADRLGDYQFGNKAIHHQFCPTCGIGVFGRGTAPNGSAMVAVKLNTLDDATPEELAAAPVRFVDGAHDDFRVTPSVTSYL